MIPFAYPLPDQKRVSASAERQLWRGRSLAQLHSAEHNPATRVGIIPPVPSQLSETTLFVRNMQTE
jgi:hypothetical protein